MTLRQSIARRAAQDALFAMTIAAVKSLDPSSVNSVVLAETFVGVLKPRADMIAKACGARTLWRNGYYMATREFGQVQVEIHFAPLITTEDAQ